MNYKDLGLKNGNVVEMNDGYKYLYLENVDTQYTKDYEEHNFFVSINKDYASWEKAINFDANNVIAIYRVYHPYCFVAHEQNMPERMLRETNNLYRVRSVTPPKKMTIEEIEAELGYKIQIVDE